MAPPVDIEGLSSQDLSTVITEARKLILYLADLHGKGTPEEELIRLATPKEREFLGYSVRACREVARRNPPKDEAEEKEQEFHKRKVDWLHQQLISHQTHH